MSTTNNMIKNIARAQDQLLKKLKKTPSSSYFIFHQARVALLTAGETLLIGENHLKTICKNRVYNGCQKITLHMKTKFAPNVKKKSVLCSLEIVS